MLFLPPRRQSTCWHYKYEWTRKSTLDPHTCILTQASSAGAELILKDLWWLVRFSVVLVDNWMIIGHLQHHVCARFSLDTISELYTFICPNLICIATFALFLGVFQGGMLKVPTWVASSHGVWSDSGFRSMELYWMRVLWGRCFNKCWLVWMLPRPLGMFGSVFILPSGTFSVNRSGCGACLRWLRCHQKCSRRWCRKWINRPIDPQFLASKKNTFDTHTHTHHPITALFVHAMTGITGIFSLRSWLPVWQWDIWPTFSQRLMQRSGSTWGQPFGWTGEPCNSQNLRSHETPVNACWSTGTRMRILTCQCRPGWVNSQVDSEREEARNP